MKPILMISLLAICLQNTFAQSTFAQSTNKPEPAFPFLSALNNVRDLSLSASQDEAYFTIQSPAEDKGVIVCMKKSDDLWGPPELLPFCGRYRDIEPFLSPDGLRLYFSSDRPVQANSHEAKDYDIWFVWRSTVADQWSEPIHLGPQVNTAKNEFYPAITRQGNLYFTSDAPGGAGKDDIWMSIYNGKGYQKPVPLDTNINSSGYEFNAWVSPDEDLMIFTRYGAADGMGSGDLYVSKRNGKQWSKPMNLGKDINTKYMEYCPYYDAATQTLYFTSRRNNIEDKQYPDLKSFIDAISAYENGQSRLYQVHIEKL